ncbi:type III polyketide synthase [Fulvivirga kasyanovii]|uniref:Type III polyketide synthase n=1 Tax=Fulvivirga kasyanovii TaxID=396812 RepID=A0ABW9RIJ4_9BACT|nr:type III polyketide synthase [Fulvivirga kasyanovii]MTI23727.1 type III polyketide synthase [Fulvivirga kasyanovii]
MNAYITSIATANPKFKIKQQDVLDFMIKAHRLEGADADKLRVLYRATGILSRYSVIEDYTSSLVHDFFPDNDRLEPFPTTQDRLGLFQQEAIGLSVEAAKKAIGNVKANQITHLITVSCTGMYAPGIDIELVDRLGLNSHVERTGINFMGCYAAFNALKVADAICTANSNACVLIVCVELCSIHFQKEAHEDYMLANALFGDGAAAVLMSGRPGKGVNLKTTSFFNELFRNGHEHMAWKIGDFGFEMRLSAYVPDVIESGIKQLTQRLVNKSGVDKFDYFAVHPGGKKILQVIEKELSISKRENQAAHDILAAYGNMSSPTILFVLKRILDQLKAADNGKNLLGLAFGPGLTLESMLLTIEVH